MSADTAKRWVALIFLVLVFAVIGLEIRGHGPCWIRLWSNQPSQDSSYSEARSNKNENAKSPLTSTPNRSSTDRVMPLVGNGGHPPISDPNEAERIKREKDDLQAQQDMAWWAMLMFVATSVAVVVTGFGVWYVRSTLNETVKLRVEAQETTTAAFQAATASDKAASATLKAAEATFEANKQGREAFINQQRAWLTLDVEKSDFESPFDWTDDEGRVDIDLVFRNFGATPAFKAALVAPEFIIGSRNINKAREAIAKRMDELPLNAGYTVAPNELLHQKFHFSIDRENAESYIRQQIGLGVDERSADFSLFIVGCMTYELAFDGERRNTPFVVVIERLPNNAWGSRDPRPELGDVAFRDLQFGRWPIGDISPE